MVLIVWYGRKVELRKEVWRRKTKDETRKRGERRVQNKPQTLCEKRNETMCVFTNYMAMHKAGATMALAQSTETDKKPSRMRWGRRKKVRGFALDSRGLWNNTDRRRYV